MLMKPRSSCAGFTKIVTHEPLGVCAAICPFNAPVATMFLKVAPALATGNVIVSPSPLLSESFRHF